MLRERGVIAYLLHNRVHGRCQLNYQRDGGDQCSIDCPRRLQSKLLFWGSHTDRHVLCVDHEVECTDLDRDGPNVPLVHVFDLDHGTCMVLHKFSALDACEGGWISAFACSRSGRTIAACVEEGFDDYRTVQVAWFADDGRSRTVCNIGIRQLSGSSCSSRLLVFFAGVRGNKLIVIDTWSARVFYVGCEDPMSGCFVFDEDRDVFASAGSVPGCTVLGIAAVTPVIGTDSILLLMSDLWNNYVVLEVELDAQTCAPLKKKKLLDEPSTTFRTELRVISQECGTGVTVYSEAGHCSHPLLYNMRLSTMRQAWMEACVRACQALVHSK
jgi:hypothetical protein